MKILVTGGAGYIGSHVCKCLAAKGYLPIAYDNLSRGRRAAVKWGPLELGDIAERDRLFPLKPCAVVSPFNRSRPGRIKTTRSRPGTIFYFLRLGDATAKSSSQLPSLIAATSQREVAPPPAQVFPCLSRYLIGTVRPLSADPRPILIGRTPIPKRASWF